MIGPRTRSILVGIVTCAWVVNFAAGFVVTEYKQSEAINGAFMLVVGAIFAAGAKPGKDDEKPPPPPPPAKKKQRRRR